MTTLVYRLGSNKIYCYQNKNCSFYAKNFLTYIHIIISYSSSFRIAKNMAMVMGKNFVQIASEDTSFSRRNRHSNKCFQQINRWKEVSLTQRCSGHYQAILKYFNINKTTSTPTTSSTTTSTTTTTNASARTILIYVQVLR